jgi:two-component system sensor histidine kinase MprB
MLERAISNLIDNAAKFSPEGSPIEVTADATSVSVRDHGIGIDDDDLAHVFDRFYRAPRSRTLPGSGLGLSIVQYVADAHGGEAFARNEPDGGATVGFTVHPGE